jgi:hypothetical protein
VLLDEKIPIIDIANVAQQDQKETEKVGPNPFGSVRLPVGAEDGNIPFSHDPMSQYSEHGDRRRKEPENAQARQDEKKPKKLQIGQIGNGINHPIDETVDFFHVSPFFLSTHSTILKITLPMRTDRDGRQGKATPNFGRPPHAPSSAEWADQVSNQWF